MRTIAYSDGRNGSRVGPVDGEGARMKLPKYNTSSIWGLRGTPGRFVWLYNPSSWHDLLITYIPSKSLYLGCVDYII